MYYELVYLECKEEYADLKYILQGFSKGKIEERRYRVGQRHVNIHKKEVAFMKKK